MDFVDALALITACLYYCSPGFAMLWAGSMVQYAPYPYVYNLTGCVLWIMFGGQHHLDATYRLNIFGAIAYAAYLIIFLWRVDAADARRRLVLRYFIGGGAAVLLAGVMLRAFASEVVFGWYCSIVSCLASGAPALNLREVLRTKSMERMPPLLIPSIAFPNGVLWTIRNTVGIPHIDYRLVVSTGFAVFCAVVQIGLHILFWVPPPPPPPPPPPRETDLHTPLMSGEGGDRDVLPRVQGEEGGDKDNRRSDDVEVKEKEDDNRKPDDLRLNLNLLEEVIALELKKEPVDFKDHPLSHGNPTQVADQEKLEPPAVTPEAQEETAGGVQKSSEPAPVRSNVGEESSAAAEKSAEQESQG